MEQQNKLAQFERAVYAEADAKAEEIRREAETQMAERLQRHQEELRIQSAEQIQKQSQAILQRSTQKIAQENLEAKRSILRKRNELTDRIFNAVAERLADFVRTPAYRTFLLEQIRTFAAATPLPGVQIHVGTQDLALASEIREAYGLECSVVEKTSLRLGGFQIRDEAHSAYFDESLSQRLAEQKEIFYSESPFALE